MAVSRKVLKWSLDVIITLLVLFLTLASYFGLVPVHKQGFHCSDHSITYAFRGDSISLAALIAICVLVPILFILLVEFWRHRPLNGRGRKSSSSSEAPIVAQRTVWRVYWRCCAAVYGTYFFGLVCSVALIELLKVAIGELRPHFLDTCRPDFAHINCSEGYITNYTCTRPIPIYHLIDSYKSFPSGHAALAVYMSLFLCFYVHKQVFPSPTYLSSSMLQVGLVFWAVYCSMSRIRDRRHHWWDVLAGFALGVVCASYSAVTWLWTYPPRCHIPSSTPSLERRRSRSCERSYGSCVDQEQNSRQMVFPSFLPQTSVVYETSQSDANRELRNNLSGHHTLTQL